MNPIYEKIYPDLGISDKETSIHIPGGPTVTNRDAVSIAEGIPEMQVPAKAAQSIQESKKNDWKSTCLRTLSFFAGVALGVMTGLAVAGVMVTPAGWAIAGGVLFMVLIGSALYGGPEEFAKALAVSLAGIIGGGIGLGYTAGALIQGEGIGIMAGILLEAILAGGTLTFIMLLIIEPAMKEEKAKQRLRS
jgi:hypothetical protein